MAKQSKSAFGGKSFVYWGRLAIAFFAILVAATHLAGSSGGGGSAPRTASTAPVTTVGTSPTGTVSAGTGATLPVGGSGFSQPIGAQLLPLWLSIEVITYTIIAVVYLFGVRTWYLAATVFNAFNLVLYLLSGLIAIPGITGGAFASHVSFTTLSVTSGLLVFSWFAMLVLGLLLLRHDPGSDLEKLVHGKKSD